MSNSPWSKEDIKTSNFETARSIRVQGANDKDFLQFSSLL